ncbi:STAS domain-containing protein [Kitasatospora sp. NBC_01539]|uniref:STAS domain-containing protein n=1 Tax=Kitasatospora sp. NBC_01539 TaxID=2903577 RepID=UPI00386032D3
MFDNAFLPPQATACPSSVAVVAPTPSPPRADRQGPLTVHTVRALGGLSRVRVAGEIDQDNAAVLRDALLALPAGTPRAIDLDLRDVTFIDCAGLNILLELRQHGLTAGFPVRLRAASPPVVRLLDVCDALPLFTHRTPPTPTRQES